MSPLSPYAKRTLVTLSKLRSCRLEKLSDESGLLLDQVRKAVEELKTAGLASVKTRIKRKIAPGMTLKKLGFKLPERIITEKLRELGEATPIELEKSCNLPREDFLAGLGKAREKEWISYLRVKEGTILRPTGKDLKRSAEEALIEKLASIGELSVKELSVEETEALNSLMKRPNLIEETVIKESYVVITEKGMKQVSKISLVETISSVTSELIKTGRWRGAVFEKYDLNAKSYPIHPGKHHPLTEVVKEIREIFISMGFEEIEDPIIQLAFWNFDALFQPQDHPARDMQDSFYIESPERGEIKEKDLIYKVKAVHENGWITGSTGWGGKWDLEEARKLVLRTHTTAATIKEVYRMGNKPRKAFIVGNVFRNEKMTFKNTPEFLQVDGIVIERRANVRQLMGVITEFYKRLGLRKIKFWPSYFPYTEPSIQTSVYVERLGKWVELMGMGIFRPEVTKPLGVDWPVLAWGGGIERIAMLRYDLTDIRDLYGNDLGWLRRRPVRRRL